MKDLQAIKIARRILCVIIALLVLITDSSRAQGNLLVNNGWNISNPPGGNVLADSGSGTNNFIAYFIYNGGTISQTFSTVPGTFYLLTFQAIEFQGTNYCGVNVGSLSTTLNFASTVPIQGDDGLGGIYANGNPDLNNTIWENFSFTFEATSASSMLSLIYYPQEIQVTNPTSAPDYYWGAGGVKNISVITAPVPEPSTVALWGASLAGWLAYSYRSRLNKAS